MTHTVRQPESLRVPNHTRVPVIVLSALGLFIAPLSVSVTQGFNMFWVIVAAAHAALLLVGAGTWAQLARGRSGRCIRCGYSTHAPVCTEYGVESHERIRTSRILISWLVAIAALIMIADATYVALIATALANI